MIFDKVKRQSVVEELKEERHSL